MKDYSYMDTWDDKKISEFKEEGLDQQEVFVDKLKITPQDLFKHPKIVAEGDSWFDYKPGTDLIDCLRKHHGHLIKNYSDAGDTLENMVYGTKFDKGSFKRKDPTIYQVLRKIEQLKPQIFLFSGGGNDVAGDEFGSYLNHSETTLPALRLEYLDYMINTIFKKCCIDLIEKIKKVSPNTHIIMHGYGHTLPTGKGVSIIGFKFAGPWLRPALTAKKILNETQQINTIKVVINKYNEMLKLIANSRPNFHYVDLRPIINPDNDWVNELHLKNSAYAKAADKINEVIIQISK